ncbi:GMP synthase (glutamine-hydrolysing) [Chitinophaga sp. CF118]|uniref:glutamine amidotransferase-related protein n=1 Tax=Chitinophaga sp. CF118 TaxID=1884367 RepID=UPI0008DF7199|nr:gamma-glutamyl-gamma-aminobutyrate hydrolase family protein [Chitinophaga sp. CF118]SFD17391.1 GMP synthase (glutamine-hydrolysing) [Chitinophaga sp. CF118]
MNILCITHADFETPGVITSWASNNDHYFKVEKPYKGEPISDVTDFDFLIVMGGPQSPLKTNEFPYLALETDLIRSAIKENKPVLGLCLGAQLIGEALGAKTSQSPEKEVGVYPVTLTTAGINDPLLKDFPDNSPVIHWHNDMPGLTAEAVVLAYSPGCPRQIVRYKKNVYGFQCHLEIDADGIRKMITACPEDFAPSKYTQTQQELLAQNYSSINELMLTFLDRFIDLEE